MTTNPYAYHNNLFDIPYPEPSTEPRPINRLPNNTRFNPTTNGRIHIGHLYLALVNEAEAHATGGKFIVRWDDNQDVYRWCLPGQNGRPIGDIDAIRAEMRADIEWAGVSADAYISQADEHNRMTDLIYHLNGDVPLEVKRAFLSAAFPEIGWADWDTVYPYVPHFTAEKVMQDFAENINLLIRGEDLITEFSLYSYFCELWGIPNPRHVYLSRLTLNEGEQLADVSKTRGSCSIKSFRDDGWTPAQLLAELATACLIDPSGSWMINNVKPRPVWGWKESDR